jgi:hypothetical protein
MSDMPDVLKREIKVLAFDQYGTIVDMQTGLTEAVTPFLKQKGWDGKPNNFVTWWRRTSAKVPRRRATSKAKTSPLSRDGQKALGTCQRRKRTSDSDLDLSDEQRQKLHATAGRVSYRLTPWVPNNQNAEVSHNTIRMANSTPPAMGSAQPG